MSSGKFFLVGKIAKARAAKPNNTIIDNFTLYQTKKEAKDKAEQLLLDDRNLIDVLVCKVDSKRKKTTTVTDVE